MRKKVVVLGSFVTDLTSRSEKLPIPGETVLGSSFQMGPGGKGSNQAVAAHRAGADVTMITKVGRDVFGREALEFYRSEGMDTTYFLMDDRHATGSALINVDSVTAQNQIVVVIGACDHITHEDLETCRAQIEGAGILLLQHEINSSAQYEAIEMAHRAGVQIILNPAPAAEIPGEIMKKLDVVTPNETEVQALTGICVRNGEDAKRAAEVLFQKGVKQVVITMGKQGAFAADKNRSEWIPRIPVEARDTTGAGDAFNGGFVMAMSEGKDLFTSLRYGNVTGALSVTRTGSSPSMPMREDIQRLYQETYLNKEQ